MLRKAAILSAYISVPVYLIAYALMFSVDNPIVNFVLKIYWLSVFILTMLSKNVHSINFLLSLIVTFVQTYCMVFILVIIFLIIKRYVMVLFHH